MSLISWIIIAMIVVTSIAVILNVWRSKLYAFAFDSPFGLFAVVCSLAAIEFGCLYLAFGHTPDQVGVTVTMGISAVAAIVLTIVQFDSCFRKYRWRKSHGRDRS